jgi:Reverse transcriptase (RNA-dependent DNA polymerase)
LKWNSALSNLELSKMAKAGKLNIIFKKSDSENLKNYRPLTLMTDYKIITKALADRLKDLVKEVVGGQQTGFIKGRQIRTNIIEAYLEQNTSGRTAPLQ